jgi:WD40 repeat protein
VLLCSSFAACSVLRNLLPEEDSIISVCFSRDGKYLATGSGDGCVYVSFFSNDCPPFDLL